MEGDWVLVDKTSVLTPGPEKGIDNNLLESAGAAYLDEGEDFRGYSAKSSMEPEELKSTDNSIGAFFRRQTTKIKSNFEQTDIKGGAKRTGARISESIKEINVKEKTKSVKKGFMRFATKVKGFFKTEGEDENDTIESKFKSSASHDKNKKML